MEVGLLSLRLEDSSSVAISVLIVPLSSAILAKAASATFFQSIIAKIHTRKIMVSESIAQARNI